MALKNINGVLLADIVKLNGITKASVPTINGTAVPKDEVIKK